MAGRLLGYVLHQLQPLLVDATLAHAGSTHAVGNGMQLVVVLALLERLEAARRRLQQLLPDCSAAHQREGGTKRV